jgi:hypothetical protein
MVMAAIVILLITSAGGVGIANWIANIPVEDTETTTEPETPPNEPLLDIPYSQLDNFSFYTDYEDDFEIDAPQYEVNPDLSNIGNLDGWQELEGWSPEVESLISENYFAAVQNCNYSFTDPLRPYYQFSEIYDDNYWRGIPSFVTADSMYHIFHVLYDYALRTMETDNLTVYLEVLIDHLLENTIELQEELDSQWWVDCTTLNVAFFSVVKKCLSPDWTPPTDVIDWVDQTINLIEAAHGFSRAWFMDQREDFSQYKPRGHYTRSEELEYFFKAMMFLGRVVFRLHPNDDWRTESENNEKGLQETAQAILICHALNDSSDVLAAGDGIQLWKSIYLPTSFFVGESDDLKPLEYLDCMKDVYGAEYRLSDLEDDTKLKEFRGAADELRNPRILSDFMWYYEEMEVVTKGMSVMGQRYVPDSYMFWQLVFPNVGNLTYPRLFPKGLDVMCVLGSERAEELLAAEKVYENYAQQLEMLKQEFANQPDAQWIQNLYWLWLHSIRPMLEMPDTKAPSFMKTNAWQDKRLLTSLGTWTELRHDTILYAKQSYTGYLGLMDPIHGYVEPVPRVYARLASLSKMLLDGLIGRSLISSELEEKLSSLHNLLLHLKDIAEKELKSEQLNQTDIDIIRYIHNRLRSFERIAGERDADRAAVIADVHTDSYTKRVLEEATGNPMVVFVAVPDHEGNVYLTRGAIYSYYEFTKPMSERMTDEEWWQVVDSPECPDMPDWVRALVGNADGFTPATAFFGSISAQTGAISHLTCFIACHLNQPVTAFQRFQNLMMVQVIGFDRSFAS